MRDAESLQQAIVAAHAQCAATVVLVRTQTRDGPWLIGYEADGDVIAEVLEREHPKARGGYMARQGFPESDHEALLAILLAGYRVAVLEHGIAPTN